MNELRSEASAVNAESRSRTLHPITTIFSALNLSSVKERLDAKRENLRRRREVLEQARQVHADDLRQETQAELVLRVER